MTKRTERLDSEYRREISAILSGPLKNREPNFGGIVSVTEVSVAPDLKTAKAYVSVYATEEQKREDLRILRANAGFVRHELARVMRMRTVPEVTFLEDGSMEYGSKMDELFAKIHKDDEHD